LGAFRNVKERIVVIISAEMVNNAHFQCCPSPFKHVLGSNTIHIYGPQLFNNFWTEFPNTICQREGGATASP